MMKNDNYILVHGWMINELNLKGTELLIYALIYSFSRDGKTRFQGTYQWIAETVGVTRRQVIDTIKRLIEKGYVTKHEKCINGTLFYDFSASGVDFTPSEKTSPGECKNFTGGSEETSPHKNNNHSNKDIYIKKDTYVSKENSLSDTIDEYTSDDELRTALYEFVEMRKRIKKPLSPYALKLALKKLKALGNGSVSKEVQIVNQSVLGCYQGLFDLKPDQTKKTGATIFGDNLTF